MKRLILYVTVMLMTFALGAGIDRLLARESVDHTPPVKVLPVEPREELATTVTPVAPAPSATPIIIRDYDPKKFTPWAALYIMGATPKEFADFDSIEMALNDSGADEHGYLAVYTRAPEGEYDSVMAFFALVTEQRLFFATSKSDSGIEYRFDGKFLRTDFLAVEGKNIPVLRGTLTKSKDGRTIAEHTFNFRMEPFGC